MNLEEYVRESVYTSYAHGWATPRDEYSIAQELLQPLVEVDELELTDEEYARLESAIAGAIVDYVDQSIRDYEIDAERELEERMQRRRDLYGI